MTLKLKGSTSGHTAIEAPASAGSNTIILPANNGSANQYLKNSSTPGTLEFASLGALGQVVQYKHSTKTDVSSRQHSTFVDVPGTDENGSGSIWECNITTTGSNKVLVIASVNVGGTNMNWLKLIRNTGGTDNDLGKGDTVSGKRSIWWGAYGGGGSTGEMYYGVDTVNHPILDSPGAGTHSYRVQFASDGTSHTCYINRSVYDADPYHPRTISSITLLELSA
tara:strand:+ start:619 stop:1287 length:669 start_codon:yes stop_codon:yes gene_type:complete